MSLQKKKKKKKKKQQQQQQQQQPAFSVVSIVMEFFIKVNTSLISDLSTLTHHQLEKKLKICSNKRKIKQKKNEIKIIWYVLFIARHQ
jgi:hypothetical protein